MSYSPEREGDPATRELGLGDPESEQESEVRGGILHRAAVYSPDVAGEPAD